MIGIVTSLKASGAGSIRGDDGIAYTFTRADGDHGELLGEQVLFSPVGPRFGRWFARNLTRSTSTTNPPQGATQ